MSDSLNVTGEYVKSAIYGKKIDEETRKQMIMSDCISQAFSQLSAPDLELYLFVSQNLTIITEEVIREKILIEAVLQETIANEITENGQGPVVTPTFTVPTLTQFQTPVNSMPHSEEHHSLDLIDVNRLNQYFGILRYFGNVIPTCYYVGVNSLPTKK